MILAALAAALPGAVRALFWKFEQNAYLRGRLIAEEQGCFNCHLAERPKEIPNPGSRWGTVPRFFSGNAMMYAPDREGIVEFIRYGAPRHWLDNPEIRQRLGEQRIRMPAYAQVLSEAEIDDLATYITGIEKVDLAGEQDPAIRAGRSLARENGCIACHGYEGAGGLPNPGSLGGFIPGFLGRNFTDMVASEEEFHEWIRTGRLERLERNPVVRFFWDRQRMSMPAYGEELTDEEIGQLWKWVQAVRQMLDAGP